MQEDHTYEVSQARRVQAARAALTSALSPALSKRKVLLEDLAAQAAELTPNREDRVRLGQLREAYISEVNRFWLYAENAGITEKLVRAWLGQNRKHLAGVDRTEYSAEATFVMRQCVTLFEARGATLTSYAWRSVLHALSEYRDRAEQAHGAKGPADGYPEGTTPDELIDDVTPLTVLLAKREMPGADL